MERDCWKIICGVPTTSQGYGIDLTRLTVMTFNKRVFKTVTIFNSENWLSEAMISEKVNSLRNFSFISVSPKDIAVK